METYAPRLLTSHLQKHAFKVKDRETNKSVNKPVEVKTPSKEKTSATPNVRLDGRTSTQLRPIFTKTGVITQASGSAYLEIENTKIIVAVYGPRQSKKLAFSDQGQLWCEFKFAPFAQLQRRKKGQDPEEKTYSLALQDALSVSIQLDKFPKSVIEVYATVLEEGGGVLPAALTCASLALANAGIDLFNLVAACSAGYLDGQLILDPSLQELSSPKYTGEVVVACMPSLQQITHISQQGLLDQHTLGELVKLSMDGCSRVFSLMRNCLFASLVPSLFEPATNSSLFPTPTKPAQDPSHKEENEQEEEQKEQINSSSVSPSLNPPSSSVVSPSHTPAPTPTASTPLSSAPLSLTPQPSTPTPAPPAPKGAASKQKAGKKGKAKK